MDNGEQGASRNSRLKPRTNVWRVKNPDWTQGHCLPHTRSLYREADADKEHRPVKSPLDRGKENECLEQMLDDGPSPIILDPASANCFREWHADSCGQDKHSITERQRPRVLREHSGKL